MEQAYSRREHEKNLTKKDVKDNMEETFIRQVLAGPLSGYDFMNYIKNTFGVSLGPSEIYPRLHKIEKNGHVRIEKDTSGDRTRKIYHPIPVKTRNYLQVIQRVKSTNRKKMNKISPRAFSVETPILPQID